ncbi:beta-glucoside-specific PTS transporter subunit IIABC [Holdemania massiliensis]|uniref:beta-glucoside-specific PTS transporter subunit IIABC n=1 Tax=Holdemania massiliensis TaxID=1468449 RepID=UPI001F060644|nr:beta-glucoside-specific PTS transporter subunit IIABC [Holdemania massiliensis]MCH1941409.1 beta-glucoside-specific PTS transporter subunit IIABC [Holdemania massiliensis]
MDYKQTAAEILKYVGTEKNVAQLEHCSTRLRFTLNDQKKVDEEKLKAVPGVMGVVRSNQFQIIIGNDVVEVYDALLKMIDFKGQDVPAVPAEKQKLSKVALDFLIGIFQPLVPAIAGAGVLKSILILLVAMHLMDDGGALYKILVSISDATFYFLPMMVAVTTANKLKSNRLVAIAAVGVTLLPAVTTMIAEGTTLFGIQLQSIAYNAQVFPAILCVSFLALMERLMNKVSPKPIRIFFVPMVALAVTVPVTLLFLGPLGYNIGQIFTAAILFLYDKLGFVALAVLSAILPLMVATGMHKTLIPYAISTFGELGYEMLYMPASLAHNVAESGACFAVALKAKNETLKSTAFSAGISAFMGITEPALYGVTLQNKKVLYSVMLGGAITGAYLGLTAVKAFAIVGPGAASMSMFIDGSNGMNIVWALIGFVVALASAFLFTFILWKEETPAASTSGATASVLENRQDTLNVLCPIVGEVVALDQVGDEMFSKKALGEGVAIIPEVGELRAPADGTIQMVFETKHSLGMTTANGTEILFHVGLDTVNLQGKPFTPMVKAGDVVKTGDLLLKFDIQAIKDAGLDPITPIVVTNSQDMNVIVVKTGHADQQDIILQTQRKEG